MGVSVTSITVTTGISSWLSKAFFPFKRNFPDCKLHISIKLLPFASCLLPILTKKLILHDYLAMWKYVLYSRQYSNVTKTCSSIDSLGLVPLLDGLSRETSAWDFGVRSVERSVERWIRVCFNTFYCFYHLSICLLMHTETKITFYSFFDFHLKIKKKAKPSIIP